MPELPEVETVRRSLLSTVLNKKIIQVDVFYERILQDAELAQFNEVLVGNSFRDIKRRGKYLLFELNSGHVMVAHLRMTGQLIFVDSKEVPNEKHTAVVFQFTDAGELRFVDQRKFATINLLTPDRLFEIAGLRNMGPEPLSPEFTYDIFSEMLQGRTVSIKGFLLNQSRIAGLGNIYADEALFAANIHPERPAGSLHKDEERKLHKAIRDVLRAAIAEQGTTFRNYRTGTGATGMFQNKLLVYGKKEQPCSVCGTKIAHRKIAGRTSHFCPVCQKESDS